MEFTASKRVGEQGTGEQEISFFALVYFLYKQDLRKSTFKKYGYGNQKKILVNIADNK